jgi:hypothetical protein
MPLPDPQPLPQGATWSLHGICYQVTKEKDTKRWTRICGTPPPAPPPPLTNIFEENECYTLPPERIALDLSPPAPRGRGRPRSNPAPSSSASAKRPLSAYNLFIQKQMLAGAFAHLSGQDRMREISKMYKCARP